MLNKSLLTVLVLAVTVTTAGAETGNETVKAQPIEQESFELALDSQLAGCEANATDAQLLNSWTSSLEQQSSTQLEQLFSKVSLGDPIAPSPSRARYCWWTGRFWICF